MTNQEKLAALEDMMELDAGTLRPETRLDALEEWDSLSALSFVVLLGDEFGRRISGREVRGLETVGDMLPFMEPEA